MHPLIVGARGVGKSTLLNKVVNELNLNVWGFKTKKEVDLTDEKLGSPVYIYEAGKPPTRSRSNLVGHCTDRGYTAYKEAFDIFAPKIMAPPPKNSIITFDEIGFMESTSESFCSGILFHLGNNNPLIATVKHNDFPFLNKVRNHANCKCFNITKDNRNDLYFEILDFMKGQINKN